MSGAETNRTRPLAGVIVGAATMASLTAGAMSLINASDTSQNALNRERAAEPARFVPCPGQFSVSGWGDTAILVILRLALVVLGLAMIAAPQGRGSTGVGLATGVVAAFLSLALWIDAYEVSHSSLGDCDGTGLSGAPSVAVNTAGWLLVVSIALSLVMATRFQSRTALGLR